MKVSWWRPTPMPRSAGAALRLELGGQWAGAFFTSIVVSSLLCTSRWALAARGSSAYTSRFPSCCNMIFDPCVCSRAAAAKTHRQKKRLLAWEGGVACRRRQQHLWQRAALVVQGNRSLKKAPAQRAEGIVVAAVCRCACVTGGLLGSCASRVARCGRFTTEHLAVFVYINAKFRGGCGL